MVLGAGGGDTVAFNIRAVADLSGIKQTSAALTDLSKKGSALGSDIAKGSGSAAQSMSTLSAKTQALSSDLTKISNAGLLVGGGIAAGLGVAVRTFASFEHEMNAVRSVTGATGDEFKQLNQLALDIGRDTVFSASQAAVALEELAKAGVSVKDILGGAAEGATALAAAASIGIPEAAALIATTLNIFQLGGDQASHVADVFTNVANTSAAGAQDFGDALTYIGASAQALGIPLEDVSTAIAVLADQGIAGSTAGTSLREAFTSLVAPSAEAADEIERIGLVVKDSNGDFIGLVPILEQLTQKYSKLGNAERLAALTTIFGIRGATAINDLLVTQTDAADAAGKSWDDYSTAIHQTGTALEQAKIRNAGLAGSFQQLSGSLEIVSIAIGGRIAPAIALVANGITQLANGFSKLPSLTQSVIGFGLLAAGALALLAAAGARLIVIGQSTVATWTRVAGAFTQTAVASEEAAGGMTAAGAAASGANTKAATLAGTLGTLARFAASAILITVAVQLTGDILNATENGGSPGLFGKAEELGQALGGAIADGFHKVGADTVGNAIEDSLSERALELNIQDKAIDVGFTIKPKIGGSFGEALIKELNLTVADVAREAQGANLPVEEILLRHADALGLQIPALEEYRKSVTSTVDVTGDLTAATTDSTAAIEDQTQSIAEQVDEKIKSKQAQDELTQAVQDTENAQFLASAAGEGLLLPFTRNAEDAQGATEKFNKTLEDMQQSAITGALGLGDIAPELDGLQTGFGKVGDSVVDLFRKMDDAGVVDFSPAVRQALDVVSALAKVDAKIADVEAAITNNQGDLSMWQGRIDLVTNTFGISTQAIGGWLDQLQNGTITQDQFNNAVAGLAGSGGMPKLDALLAQGKITRDEYNDAVTAGIHLVQRSAGGMQDEEGEIVRNIIALDKYVSAHDDADAAVNNLSDSQRGFLLEMQSSKVQTYLQTLQLLFYLATIGQIPEEKVTEFIVLSDADEDLHAINQSLSLIPGEKSVVISATVNDAIADMERVKGVIVDTTADGATITINADTEEAAQEFIDLNQDVLNTLDGRELVVKVKGDDGEWQTVRDEVIGDEIPDKTVKITAQGPDALPFATPAGIPINAPSASVTQAAPVVLTAEDQITPVVDDVNTTLTTFQTNATNIANATGQAIAQGLQTGFQIAAEAAAPAISTIVNSLNIGNLVYNYGFNDGYNFGVGFANGITATAASVFNAAFNVGYMAHLGTQAGMDAHSPSRLAAKDGQNWVESFVSALNNGKQSVRAASADLSAQMQIGAVPVNSMQSMVLGDRRAQSVLAATSAGGSVHSSSHVVHINLGGVHGVTDPAAVSERVITDLYRSLDRQDSAGLFRR